jgi:hypothetical protein
VLCSAIAEAQDFNAAQSAHARFLTKLQQGTHLASHHISAALAQPLTTSLKLCKLLRERSSVMDVQLLEVTNLQGEFERQLCYLFKLLTQVRVLACSLPCAMRTRSCLMRIVIQYMLDDEHARSNVHTQCLHTPALAHILSHLRAASICNELDS